MAVSPAGCDSRAMEGAHKPPDPTAVHKPRSVGRALCAKRILAPNARKTLAGKNHNITFQVRGAVHRGLRAPNRAREDALWGTHPHPAPQAVHQPASLPSCPNSPRPLPCTMPRACAAPTVSCSCGSPFSVAATVCALSPRAAWSQPPGRPSASSCTTFHTGEWRARTYVWWVGRGVAGCGIERVCHERAPTPCATCPSTPVPSTPLPSARAVLTPCSHGSH